MSHIFQSNSRTMTILLGLLSAFIVISIVLFPSQSFAASIHGLNIWWKYIFPPMLPVLILSEFMIGYGVVHGTGTIIAPLIRRLFGLPHVGGIALMTSLVAGFPAGAKAAADLRQKGSISREEGEHLVALSHLANPVLLVTVFGVGFIGSARIGFILAAIYYISYIMTGLILRWGWRTTPQFRDSAMNVKIPSLQLPLFARMKVSMKEAQQASGKTFGKMLSDAVIVSIQNLMVIGGYIIVFSVLSNLIRLIPLQVFSGSMYFLTGSFEIHLGTYFNANAAQPLLISIAVVSAIIGWGGVSLLMQVKSMIHQTDIRLGKYIIARLLHATCAFALTFVLWTSLNHWLDRIL